MPETIAEYEKSLKDLSIQELEGIARDIDKENYPDRYSLVLKYLNNKIETQPNNKTNRKSNESNADPGQDLNETVFGAFYVTFILLTAFVLLFIDTFIFKSGNIPIYIGILYLIITAYELKAGVSINPGWLYSLLNVSYIRKNESPDKFYISIFFHVLIGILFIFLGVLYAVKT